MVDRIYDDPALHAEVGRFAAAITAPGWSNSLGQKLVQLTMPGVPDTYQGTELWDLSLVDPDNRRPVDFGAAARAAGPHRRRLAAAGRRRPARRSCWSPAGRCGCAGSARSCSPATGRCSPTAGPPSTCSPSTAAGRSRWPPGCRWDWHATAAGATPRCHSPARPGRKCSPNTSYGGSRLAVADLLHTYPVASAGEGSQ